MIPQSNDRAVMGPTNKTNNRKPGSGNKKPGSGSNRTTTSPAGSNASVHDMITDDEQQYIDISTTKQHQQSTAQLATASAHTTAQQMPTTSSDQHIMTYQLDSYGYNIATSQYQNAVPVSIHGHHPQYAQPHPQYVHNIYQYEHQQQYQPQYQDNANPPVTNNNMSNYRDVRSTSSTPNSALYQPATTNIQTTSTKTPITTTISRSNTPVNFSIERLQSANDCAKFLKETLAMASRLSGNITTGKKEKVVEAIAYALELLLENIELKEQLTTANKRKRHDNDMDPRDDVTMDGDNDYVTKSELKSCMDDIKDSINNLANVINKQNITTTKNQQAKSLTFADIIKENKKTTIEKHQTVVFLPDNENTSMTRQTLSQLIQPAKEGIEMTDAKSLSKGKMIIDFKDKASKNKFESLAKATKKINIEPPWKLKPTIMLKGVRLDINKEEIPSMFATFNYPIAHYVNTNNLDITKLVEVVASRKNFRNELLINYIISIDPAIRDIVINELNGKIILDYALVHAEDMSPLRQCYRCYGFSHIASNCLYKPEQQVCHHCAMTHKHELCPNKKCPPQCINCKKSGVKDSSNHNSVSKMCPVYMRMLQRVADKVNYYSHE